MKPMSDGSRAVVLLNRGGSDVPAEITVTSQKLGLTNGKKFTARNLWSHTNRHFTGSFMTAVPAHNAAMFIIRTVK